MGSKTKSWANKTECAGIPHYPPGDDASAPSTNRGAHRANMSDERFTEILNELQARGDKKLMQLFGH